jgi:HEAT repeat protein
MGRAGIGGGVLQFCDSNNRTIREAVVEALGDLADDKSLTALRSIANSDPSQFIRSLANDVLSDR